MNKNIRNLFIFASLVIASGAAHAAAEDNPCIPAMGRAVYMVRTRTQNVIREEGEVAQGRTPGLRQARQFLKPRLRSCCLNEEVQQRYLQAGTEEERVIFQRICDGHLARP